MPIQIRLNSMTPICWLGLYERHTRTRAHAHAHAHPWLRNDLLVLRLLRDCRLHRQMGSRIDEKFDPISDRLIAPTNEDGPDVCVEE